MGNHLSGGGRLRDACLLPSSHSAREDAYERIRTTKSTEALFGNEAQDASQSLEHSTVPHGSRRPVTGIQHERA